MKKEEKRKKRFRRHRRVRAKLFGTADRPRLCVFRSNKHIYAQLIDDEKGHTLASASDLELDRKTEKQKNKKTEKLKEEKKEEKIRRGKVAIAYVVGRLIAKKAKKMKIEKIGFDRGGYKYHGRVKAVAEGARNGELEF